MNYNENNTRYHRLRGQLNQSMLSYLLNMPTLSQRLEAARREIRENRQKEIDGFIYGKCSKCDFGSSDYYLFKSHFTNGVCNSENSL
jgi:hypothetical protein